MNTISRLQITSILLGFFAAATVYAGTCPMDNSVTFLGPGQSCTIFIKQKGLHITIKNNASGQYIQQSTLIQSHIVSINILSKQAKNCYLKYTKECRDVFYFRYDLDYANANKNNIPINATQIQSYKAPDGLHVDDRSQMVCIGVKGGKCIWQ